MNPSILVKCINTANSSGVLTHGKIYEVIAEVDECYLIKGNLGVTRWFMTSRFEICGQELFPIF